MRFNCLLLVAFTLLSAVLALPVPEPADDELSKRNPLFDDDLSVRSNAESDILLVRDDVELFERGRVKFSPKARQDLRNQGLNRKQRKAERKSHKKAVKAYMKGIPGARKAKIHRAAHTGGTNPNEPRHATVYVYGKKPTGGKVPIKSSHGTNGHHVYM